MTRPSITVYAEPAADQTRWSLRADHGALAVQQTGMTTAQLLAEVETAPAHWPIRVHVVDLTNPIGVLPSGRTLYSDLSVTR